MSTAISTLLQPPILRTGLLPHTAIHSTGHKPPTARDIPPVTLTNIPHVEPSAFNGYLSQIGGMFDAFQRAKADAEGGGAQLFRRDRTVSKEAELDTVAEHRSRKDSSASVTTPRLGPASGFLSPVESPAPRRRTSGGVSRRGPPAPTPLSTIPSVYFEENFHLENPRTFDVVSERSEVVQQPRGTAADDGKGTHGAANGSAATPRSS
ncbi:MAG: hypothetical protein INR71_12470, partial [Terriglobus roseus]|nr:hypothetical protein [Terriglobus roseus]